MKKNHSEALLLLDPSTCSSTDDNDISVPIKDFPKILSLDTSSNLKKVYHLPSSKSARRVGGRRFGKPRRRRTRKVDFHTDVVIGESSVRVLVDTGADVNVMSRSVAREIGIEWKRSNLRLRPYGSKPLKVCGVYSGPVGFGDTKVNTDFLNFS